jgi:hypothetical protein
MSSPIYEDDPVYDRWLKVLLGIVLALTFLAGVLLIFEDIWTSIAMFGITLFEALLCIAILPRRFQVFQDRLRIVLGGPLALNIPFSSILEARVASGLEAFAHWGLRFITSTRNLVEIVRHEGLNVVIAPANRDIFLQQLYKGIKASRNRDFS